LRLAAQDPEDAGARIALIGCPMGLEGSVSEGIISAVRMFQGTKMVQMTAPISPGSSGSPVLNRAGEVIGLPTAG